MISNIKKLPIEIIGYEKCTGCYGCTNACEFDAIDTELSKIYRKYPLKSCC